MATLITTQGYRDAATVAEKSAARDYTVLVSPAFEVDGEEYAIVIDGHHSLAAALADGVEPALVEATPREDDRVSILERDGAAAYLEVMHTGESGDYLDACDGSIVW